MRFASRLLLVFMAFWLPVSLSAASAMSLAMSGKAGMAGERMELMAGGCEQHQQEAPSDITGNDCRECPLCQFACTALMSSSVGAGTAWPARVASRSAAAAIHLYVPDRLQRPPLAP